MLIVVNLRFIKYNHEDWWCHLNNFMTFWGTLLHLIHSTVNAVFYRLILNFDNYYLWSWIYGYKQGVENQHQIQCNVWIRFHSIQSWDTFTLLWRCMLALSCYSTTLILPSNQTLIILLNPSTIDEHGKWCLKKVEAWDKQRQMCRVSMTTLRAATARQCHTENQWSVKYLPHTYHAKRDGQGGSKISENCPAVRNKRVMTCKAEL